jgi:hypothetical protein
MQTVESIAAKLVKKPAWNHYNYWSLLACQVDKQENETPTCKKEKLLLIQTDTSPHNTIAAHWARKIVNRRAQTGILDTGATSGTGWPEDADAFKYTGQLSIKVKVFMLPRQEQSTCHQQDATKAQDKGWGPKNEHSPRTTLNLCTITATEKPVLEAPRCTSTGLWLIPLKADDTKANGGDQNGNIAGDKASNIGGVTERANAIFELPSTRQTILYHHASAGFPVKETFLNAVRAGNYATWPGLTIATLHKYFPNLDETQKGHMKGQRQEIRSTKQKALDHLVESERLVKIKLEPGTEEVLPSKCRNNIFVRIKDLVESIHSNQTGTFPYTSQQGNRYVMIAIHLDANYIFCKPMKNRSEDEMIEAYQKIINRMKAAGLGLKTHQLDNKASKAYKQCILQNGMMNELVPPDNHRSNLAERAIQTFKHHFISILSGVDDEFLLSLWCTLLEQTELTVNLLRQPNVAPIISAFAHVHSQHDYMKKPFALIGCAVQVHIKPKNRRTWDTRTKAGFNLGM